MLLLKIKIHTCEYVITWWKTLLHYEQYVNQIKKVSDAEIKSQIIKDKGLAWKMTKMKIRIFSIPCCVKKKRDKKIFKENLEKELNNLQVTMDSNPSQTTQDSYYTSKKDIQQIEKDELNSIIFISKIKWT